MAAGSEQAEETQVASTGPQGHTDISGRRGVTVAARSAGGTPPESGSAAQDDPRETVGRPQRWTALVAAAAAVVEAMSVAEDDPRLEELLAQAARAVAAARRGTDGEVHQ